MNLLPAKNLALFGEYFSFYFDTAFPPPIQTRLTLQIPSALVYWLFGVNSYTFTVISAVYVLLLIGFTCVVYEKGTEKAFKVIALLVPFMVPHFFDKSLRGYGEFITYFFVILSLLFYIKRPNIINLFISGFLVGLAIVTKTVGLMALPVFCLLLLLDFAFNDWRKFLLCSLCFFSGLGACILFYFIFQINVIGAGEWLSWVYTQFMKFLGQSGIAKVDWYASLDPLRDLDWYQIIWERLKITARNSEMNFVFLLLYILWNIVNAIIVIYGKDSSENLKKLVIFGVVISSGYLVWWLCITPYVKMEPQGKIRRILPAFFFIGINYLLYLYYWFDKYRSPKTNRLVSLLFMGTISICILFKISENNYLLKYSLNPHAYAAHEADSFIAELESIVGESAIVFGWGYRQSPQYALKIRGHFEDIFKYDFDDIVELENKYIFRDSYAIKTKTFSSFMEIFDTEFVLEKKRDGSKSNQAELIELKALKREFKENYNVDELKRCYNGKDDLNSYKYKHGFYDNDNWVMPYSMLLLGNDTSCHSLNMSIYVPPNGKFFDGKPNYVIRVNNMQIYSGTLKRGRNRIEVELPPELKNDRVFTISFSLDTYFVSGNKYYGVVLSNVCLTCDE